MNVVAGFLRHAARAPSAPALEWEGGTMSYGQLADHARRMAGLLAARGVGTVDRVAILLPNHPAFAVALLGSLIRGSVAAVLSPAWTPADTARALARADARLLITTQALAAALGSPPADTILVDDGPSLGALGRALGAVDADPRALPRGPSDAATILFSSGTTGDAKGVVLSHGNLAFNAAAKIRACGITPADRLAMVVPMSHCFGQNVVLLGALLAGASVRLFDRFDPERLSASIGGGEVSMLLAAPTAFQRLLARGDDAPLRRLRYGLMAAAPPPASLAADWRARTGRALAQGYGLTECSPFAAFDPVAAEEGRGVGRAITGVEIRIAGEGGDGCAPPGTAGEVLIRGPNVMVGYWRRPEASARALCGGWLHTGDVGHLDASGTLHLLDRMDDVINVAGFKAWPSDVERALASHPEVLECAAYAVPDAVRGALVAAAVVLRPGALATAGDVLAHAEARLAGFQRPARLRVLAELPRSPSGKVLRRRLAADDVSPAPPRGMRA